MVIGWAVRCSTRRRSSRARWRIVVPPPSTSAGEASGAPVGRARRAGTARAGPIARPGVRAATSAVAGTRRRAPIAARPTTRSGRRLGAAGDAGCLAGGAPGRSRTSTDRGPAPARATGDGAGANRTRTPGASRTSRTTVGRSSAIDRRTCGAIVHDERAAAARPGDRPASSRAGRDRPTAMRRRTVASPATQRRQRAAGAARGTRRAQRADRAVISFAFVQATIEARDLLDPPNPLTVLQIEDGFHRPMEVKGHERYLLVELSKGVADDPPRPSTSTSKSVSQCGQWAETWGRPTLLTSL